WACGERTKNARVSPGRLMSSVYWPLPVMKRKSSRRRTDAPIPVPDTGCEAIGLPPRAELRRKLRGLRRVLHVFHGLRASRNRLHDVVVAGATAQVAVELVANRLLVQIMALPPHHIDGGHHHAGGAEAALQTVILTERLLHRVQRPVGRSQPLDGGHSPTVGLKHQGGA